jgi:hypothetical protein
MVNLLTLVLAVAPLSAGNSLDDAKGNPFFTGFHMAETSSSAGVITFQPFESRFHDKVKLEVKIDAARMIVSAKLSLKTAFVDGFESEFAKDFVKSFLSQVAASDSELAAKICALKIGRYESRTSKDLLITADHENGSLVILTCRNDGPRIGSFITSYNLGNKSKAKP